MFVVDPGYAEQLARWGLDDLAAAMAFPAQVGRGPQGRSIALGGPGPPERIPAWRRIAGGNGESSYRLASGAEDPPWRFRTLLLKQVRYNPPTGRYLLRPSRMTREAANLATLDELGIPCPKVVAVGEVRQPSGRATRLFFGTLAVAAVIGVLIWTIGFVFSWFAGPRMGATISHAVAGLIDRTMQVGARVTAVSGGAIALGAAVLGVLRWLNRDYLVGSAMIATLVEPCQDLRQFARDCGGQGGDRKFFGERVRRLSGQLAAQLAVAHRERFVHGDLTFANLLACWSKVSTASPEKVGKGSKGGKGGKGPKGRTGGEGSAGSAGSDGSDGGLPDTEDLRVAWLACPHGRRLPPGPWLARGRMKDLARLDHDASAFLSRAERMRFLRDYLRALGGEAALAKHSEKSLARRIAAYNRRRAGTSDECRVTSDE